MQVDDDRIHHRSFGGTHWVGIPGGFGTTEVFTDTISGIFAYWHLSRTWVAGNVGSQTEHCSDGEPVIRVPE